MALAGQAVMMNWCEVADDKKAQFYQWHTQHHMIDRVGIAGFQRSRRYIAVPPTVGFFFLYEVDSLAVLGSQDYLTRLNNPTPITLRNRGLTSNGRRVLASVKLSIGAGQGGAMLTLRIMSAEDRQHDLEDFLVTQAIPAAANAPEVLSIHLLETDKAASADRPGRPPGALPTWVVIVEGLSAEAVLNACSTSLADALLTDRGSARAPERSVYRHEVTIAKTLSWHP